MSRYAAFLSLVFVPLVLGQLFLGQCPTPQNYEKNLDLEKYSGTWYVIAQSLHHPMKAVNCQTVTYRPDAYNGLRANFNISKKYSQFQQYTNGTLKPEATYKGDLSLTLNDFPRRFHFRVLHVNYSQLAVEYICLPGVFNYTASVTVLHRRPVRLMKLDSAIRYFNLTTVVPAEVRETMRLVYHNCYN